MPDDQSILRLVGLIQEAALDDEQWPAVLQELGILCSSEHLAMFAPDELAGGSTLVVARGFDPALVEAFRTTYGVMDPRNEPTRRQVAGRFYLNDDIISESEFIASPFYQEFWRHVQVGLGGGMEWRDGPRRLVVAAYRRQTLHDADRQPLHRLEGVVPYLASAMRVRGLLQQARERQLIDTALLDGLARPVMVTRADGTLLRANSNAEQLLKRGDRIFIRSGRLAARGVAARLLQVALRRLASELGTPHAVVDVPSDEAAPLRLWLTPLRPAGGNTGWTLPQGQLVLITVDDPGNARYPVQALRTLHGLTVAEARLASALVAGEDLKAYAERSRITEGTARWTLKQVLHKTGCRRQSDLVRLVMTGPAAIWRHDGHDEA